MPPSSFSSSTHTRWGAAGDRATPILPTNPSCGRPGFRVISVQFSPKSTLWNKPLPGPPDDMPHDLRHASHREAYITAGLLGSMVRSTAPERSSRYNTLRQVIPPLVLLYTPRSGLAIECLPNAATHTMLQSCG